MKLDGIRVVDLTMFLPGPMLTLMMSDHGADVIRIEPPRGEPSREMAPFVTASRCGSATPIAASAAWSWT